MENRKYISISKKGGISKKKKYWNWGDGWD